MASICARKRRAADEPDPWREIREMERGYGQRYQPLAHLREVPIPDEYAFADWAWKMQEISPIFKQFYDDQAAWQAMGVMDQQVYAGLAESYPGAAGFTFGWMPQAMLMGLIAFDPDIIHDRKRLYKFFRSHPEFQAPGAPKVSPFDPECTL